MKKSASANECGNCGQPETKSGSMNVCGRCHRVRYCDRACQAAHWKGGHKTACVDPKACNPKDQPKEDRSAEVKCLICLGTKGSTYEHACRARLHPGCLADLYKHSRKELPPCPACRAPLPSMDDILKQFSAKEQYEECLDLIQNASNGRPERIVLYQGFHLNKMERFSEAVAKFQEYLKFESISPEEAAAVHNNIGCIYTRVYHSNYSLIDAEFSMAIALSPNNANYYFHLGVNNTNQMDLISYQTGEITTKEMSPFAAAAIPAFDRCLELDPSLYRSYHYRAYGYLALGNLSAALSDARECLRMCPDYFGGHMMCGRIMLIMDKFEQARDYLLAGIDVDPIMSRGFYLALAQNFYAWSRSEHKFGRPFKSLRQKAYGYEMIGRKMKSIGVQLLVPIENFKGPGYPRS